MEQTIRIHPVVIPLMAISAGAIVANIYYSQPIFKEMGALVHVRERGIGRISMVSQLVYGLGMFSYTA